MIKVGSIFNLAITQLRKKGRTDFTLDDIIETGYKIRAFLDRHPRIAKRILEGEPISPQLKYKYKKLGVDI